MKLEEFFVLKGNMGKGPLCMALGPLGVQRTLGMSDGEIVQWTKGAEDYPEGANVLFVGYAAGVPVDLSTGLPLEAAAEVYAIENDKDGWLSGFDAIFDLKG